MANPLDAALRGRVLEIDRKLHERYGEASPEAWTAMLAEAAADAADEERPDNNDTAMTARPVPRARQHLLLPLAALMFGVILALTVNWILGVIAVIAAFVVVAMLTSRGSTAWFHRRVPRAGCEVSRLNR